jgi:hypothetical protein
MVQVTRARAIDAGITYYDARGCLLQACASSWRCGGVSARAADISDPSLEIPRLAVICGSPTEVDLRAATERTWEVAALAPRLQGGLFDIAALEDPLDLQPSQQARIWSSRSSTPSRMLYRQDHHTRT